MMSKYAKTRKVSGPGNPENANKKQLAILAVLVVVGVAAIVVRWNSLGPPEAAPAAATATAAEQQSTTPSPAPATAIGSDGAASDESSSEPADSDIPVASPAAAVIDAQKAAAGRLEHAESVWVGTWGRQLPDRNSIDMDMSHMKEPGGKAIPIPYVEPKPLKDGAFIQNADGTVNQVQKDRIAFADGTTATIDGDKILKSDGTLGVTVGDEILWSDGSKSSY
jgi:hypothetical protein